MPQSARRLTRTHAQADGVRFARSSSRSLFPFGVHSLFRRLLRTQVLFLVFCRGPVSEQDGRTVLCRRSIAWALAASVPSNASCSTYLGRLHSSAAHTQEDHLQIEQHVFSPWSRKKGVLRCFCTSPTVCGRDGPQRRQQHHGRLLYGWYDP